MKLPTPEETEQTFQLYESAYRKWANDFVPSEEELAMLFGYTFAVLLSVDPARAVKAMLAGITGAKPAA